MLKQWQQNDKWLICEWLVNILVFAAIGYVSLQIWQLISWHSV